MSRVPPETPADAVLLPSINPHLVSRDPGLERCLKHRNNLITSPQIAHLFSSIQRLTPSSRIIPAEFIQCVDCPPGIEASSAESFTPSGELQAMIGICKNRKNLSFNRIGNEVTHELVHLYDNVRFDFDVNDCNQVLCTETRSALLSGQCQLLAKNSITPSSLPTLHLSSYQMEDNGFQQCVSKRALTSTLKLAQCHGFGKLSDPHITNTIQVCMKDTSPFEVIP